MLTETVIVSIIYILNCEQSEMKLVLFVSDLTDTYWYESTFEKIFSFIVCMQNCNFFNEEREYYLLFKSVYFWINLYREKKFYYPWLKLALFVILLSNVFAAQNVFNYICFNYIWHYMLLNFIKCQYIVFQNPWVTV